MGLSEWLDNEVYLIKQHTGSGKETYHSKLANSTVHCIKDSSQYAGELIVVDKNYDLGQRIFKKVISLQDSNPDSSTFGCWPYFMEEGLEEMDAPDFNMAGFNAKEMIVSLISEGEHLDSDVKKLMEESIERACKCIIKRNMTINYTNVCVTDCFITISAGELLNSAEFLEYGREKLKYFYYHVKAHGNIAEYNSPCYSPLAINDICDFFAYVKDKESLEYADKVNRMLWEMLAEHFDYDTLQLNGPQERTYSDYTGVGFLRFIGKATGIDYTKHPKFGYYFSEEGKKEYLRKTRWKPICPPEFIPYFSGEKKFDALQRRVTDGFNYPYFEFVKIATTFKCEKYGIGTMNRSEMWHQRRPVLGYIVNKKKDTCFKVRFLHDGFDFASAAIHSVQHNSNILASINFSEKRGDTHINLDMLKDTILSAEDLRVVFELSGNMENITHSCENGSILFDVNGTRIRITPFICEFGDAKIEKSFDIAGGKMQYSLIWYKGERKNIDIAVLDKALTAFTIEFDPSGEYVKPEYTEADDFVDISWNPQGTVLGLKAPEKTFPFFRNMYEDMQSIDGVDIASMASAKWGKVD